MRIEVLGPVRLRSRDGAPLDVPERRVRALLAALVISRGETVPVDVLIDRAWGEQLPSNPQRVLQAKLSQLRRLLDSATPHGRDVLIRDPGGYRIATRPDGPAVAIDAEEFHDCLRSARDSSSPQERIASLERAESMWRGRAYGEFSDDLWVSADRSSLEEERLEAVTLWAAALVDAGEADRAFRAVREHLDRNPTREPLISVAMRAAYLSRRHPEALRLFERLRVHLAEELGSDPGEEISRLHTRILNQDPDLVPAGPEESRGRSTLTPREAHGPDDRPRSRLRTLPTYEGALYGREEESASLARLLTERRLVTLLGIGGIGKTRLATQVVSRHVTPHQEHGARNGSARSACFVDLTVLNPGNHVGAIVQLASTALQLSEAPNDLGTEFERVTRALEERRSVLVLDNCEHVIEAAASFTAELLASTHSVQVVVTSREALSLPEEQRFPLGPLDSCPGAAGNPAVELFCSRASAVAPGWEADGTQDVDAIAELCRRLDGLPLAIELAAGRMNLLSVQGVLDRISDRLELLARPGRGAPRRQQTLRGMLNWSWELLDEPAQVLLRRLAVHPAHWNLEAVESICSDPTGHDGGVLPRSEVLPALGRLVEAHLVTAPRTEDGLRYGLLETVAAYAADKLAESGERRAVARSHLEYYRGMIERARGFLFGPHGRDWVRWLLAEESHVHHAQDEALAAGDGENAVALALSTFWYHWMTGRTDYVEDTITAVAESPGPEGPARAQLRTLAAVLSDTEEVDDKAQSLLAALDGFGDDDASVRARMQVQWFAATAMLPWEQYRDRGEQLAGQAIRYLVDHDDLLGAAFAVTQRDWFLFDQWGVRPRGLPEPLDAEKILRDHGDAFGLTQMLSLKHLIAESDGDALLARAVAAEALQLSYELDFRGEAAYWETVTALTLIRDSDLRGAHGPLTRARRLAGQVGYYCAAAFAEAASAVLAHREGLHDHARELLPAYGAEIDELTQRWIGRILGPLALHEVRQETSPVT